jgi:inosine-uridine nucleoside N-ribohydrolase
VVLRAGMPTRLVTADVTLATWISAADVAAIEAVGTPFHAALAAQIRIWTSVQKRIFGSAGCDVDDDNVAFLHDPLTLACVYDESFCRFETLEIEPRIENGVLRTLEHAAPAPCTRPMRCALEVDAKRFRAHFMERLTG